MQAEAKASAFIQFSSLSGFYGSPLAISQWLATCTPDKASLNGHVLLLCAAKDAKAHSDGTLAHHKEEIRVLHEQLESQRKGRAAAAEEARRLQQRVLELEAGMAVYIAKEVCGRAGRLISLISEDAQCVCVRSA
jgi:hypothetical protein